MDTLNLKPRDIGRRQIWHAVLALTAPCHLGGADADATSGRPLVRDGAGRPYLPGTSLTGLLRGLLRPTDPEAALALFGGEWGAADDKAAQARLLIADAVVEAPAHAGIPTELRDGVRIDAKKGVAADKKKLDLELLPAGTRFRLRWQLDLYADAARNRPLLRGAVLLARAIQGGRLRLGARTRRGLGTAVLVASAGGYWRVEDFRLDGLDGWYAWLAADLDGLADDWPRVEPRVLADAEALAAYLGIEPPAPIHNPAFEVQLRLRVAGSLLIGADGQDPAGPDRAPLERVCLAPGATERVEPVLPATALAGVLRHRCLRIARTLAPAGSEVPAALVDSLFGPSEIKRRRRNWASRLWLDEVPVLHARRLRHSRVRIDPWTGGALEGLLFTEDADYGGEVRPRLRLETAASACDSDTTGDPVRALLLLALRDLADGELAIGAEGGSGRGRFMPLPSEPFAVTSNPDARLFLQPDGSVGCEPADAFAADFEALRRRLGHRRTA